VFFRAHFKGEMAMRKIGLTAVICVGLLMAGARVGAREGAVASAANQAAKPTAAGGGVELTVDGDVTTPLKLSAEDLKKMPRVTVSVNNPHTGKKEEYEGVRLEEILRRAAATLGEKLKGPAMASYVVVSAGDGYRVVFSLAELDEGFVDSQVMVADTMDGKAMSGEVGPLRVVAPKEKRPARWVRMVKEIKVVRVE